MMLWMNATKTRHFATAAIVDKTGRCLLAPLTEHQIIPMPGQ
jgi:hypothetical protein